MSTAHCSSECSVVSLTEEARGIKRMDCFLIAKVSQTEEAGSVVPSGEGT